MLNYSRNFLKISFFLSKLREKRINDNRRNKNIRARYLEISKVRVISFYFFFHKCDIGTGIKRMYNEEEKIVMHEMYESFE